MNIDEMILVLQGHKDGKDIQVKGRCDEKGWTPCPAPLWMFESLDYRIKPEKKVAYINIYPAMSSYLYASRELADIGAASHRDSCIRVEYEEGQVDD